MQRSDLSNAGMVIGGIIGAVAGGWVIPNSGPFDSALAFGAAIGGVVGAIVVAILPYSPFPRIMGALLGAIGGAIVGALGGMFLWWLYDAVLVARFNVTITQTLFEVAVGALIGLFVGGAFFNPQIWHDLRRNMSE